MIDRAVKHLDKTVSPAEDSRMLAGAVLRAALPNDLLEDFVQHTNATAHYRAVVKLEVAFRRELERRRERGFA